MKDIETHRILYRNPINTNYYLCYSFILLFYICLNMLKLDSK